MNRVEELRRRHQAAEQGGGPERRERQHKEGKLSARERIELLLDDKDASAACQIIEETCRTGRIGDGKIFVLPVQEVIRIRTGERGADAV